jgi:hypothetical protein
MLQRSPQPEAPGRNDWKRLRNDEEAKTKELRMV